MAQKNSLFNDLQNSYAGAEEEKLLTQASSLFQSEEVLQEVQWHLAVLKELAARPEFDDVKTGLRDRLTQIFSAGGSEEEVLGDLKGLTEVKRADGGMIELRRFLKRDRRTLNEIEYRGVLSKKLANTEFLMLNLIAFFPDTQKTINDLAREVGKLTARVLDTSIAIRSIRQEEEALRLSDLFTAYEELKTRFLRDWLGQFTSLSGDQIEGMTPEQVQELVIEHQRHQMTHLLKTEITLSELDMTERLGLHDTLECGYSNGDFWDGANTAARSGFRQFILTVIQSFGMLHGKRYAFFQSKSDKDQFLLFGVGINQLPEPDEDGLELIPYIKPFTRKSGYLLEIRHREIGDRDQYHHELRHYVLPFLFAFDQIPNFNVNSETITYFTSNY
jgi:hypothetical protein